MNKIKWGIIGCGEVCEVKSGPAFYKIKNSVLEAVMRRDEEKVKDFASRHNVEKYYTSADELINDPKINAIYIATPPSTHKEYAIKVMRAGKPVYVEKPMGLNFRECIEMIQVSKETGQKLFVGFYRRALPYFLKVKEILDEQLIGDIVCVDTRLYRSPKPSDFEPANQWRLNRQIAGGGYFFELAPHTLDMLDFLLGEIDVVKGYTKNATNVYEAEDTVSIIFRLKSGASGTGQWCFVTGQTSEQDYVRITGTKGSIEFSMFNYSPILLESQTLSESYTFEKHEHIEQPLIQTIVDELREWGKCPSTMMSAARTARILDIITNIETK